MQRDPAHLADMLEAARRVSEYLKGVSELEFRRDARLQDAVIRRLEVLGEAARRVSDSSRAAHPALPWRAMIDMRNLLIHQYDGVDLELVFRTCFEDVPPLIGELERIVSEGRG